MNQSVRTIELWVGERQIFIPANRGHAEALLVEGLPMVVSLDNRIETAKAHLAVLQREREGLELQFRACASQHGFRTMNINGYQINVDLHSFGYSKVPTWAGVARIDDLTEREAAALETATREIASAKRAA